LAIVTPPTVGGVLRAGARAKNIATATTVATTAAATPPRPANTSGEGDVYVGYDVRNNNVYESVTMYNDVLDGNHCVDIVVDIPSVSHRPSDLFPMCRSNYPGFGYNTGWLPMH
jgi:hypothetical protein